METLHKEFLISDDKNLIQIERVSELLKASYWANDRETNVIQKSIENSICFGIYKNEYQIGFARCVTDYSTMFWLGDVIIDNNYRGLGLGKALMEFITNYEILRPLRGTLSTKDAHSLYEKYGFKLVEGQTMKRKPGI